MSFAVRQACCAALLLLPFRAAGADELGTIATWQAQPYTCERPLLVKFLRHEDVRVRSAALDLLEMATGRDFGVDPWLQPSQLAPEVQKALDEWASVEEMLGEDAEAPSAEKVAEAVALLRMADPDTQRRVCLRFAQWKAVLADALQQALQEKETLSEKEHDYLLSSLFRLQLQDSMEEDVGFVCKALTSHARNEVLTGLEALRKTGKAALPVLMRFVNSGDGLLREVATDILLQNGGEQAFCVLMPSLVAESDRNILQIACRRAPDCRPIPQLIGFLNQCALSDDEDVAVAALEALADMEADADDGDTRRAVELAGAKHAMPIAQFLTLIQNPLWRVRAAALHALTSEAPFIPAVRDEALQQAILAALRDSDETVRTHAMQVMHKRKLVHSHLSELVEYALRTPSAAPYVVYLNCREKSNLNPALEELLRRFSPEQVEQLIHYDEEYESLFYLTNRHSVGARAVISALLSNPDFRVRRRIMNAWGGRLFWADKTWGEAVTEWLKDPMVAANDKSSPLNAIAQDAPKPQKRQTSVGGLCEWLEEQLTSANELQPELRRAMYAAILELEPSRAEERLDERFAELDSWQINKILDEHPQYILKLPKDVAAGIFAREDELYFSSLLSADSSGTISEYLVSLPLKDKQWMRLMENELSKIRYSDSLELGPVLMHVLEDSSQPLRQMQASFMLLGVRPECEVASVESVISSLSEAQLLAFECLRTAPQDADAVEEWARKCAESLQASVRLAAAGCLLSDEYWGFYLPVVRDGKTALFRIKSPLSSSSRQMKRVSCPVSLLRLVQGMQRDSDPAVALVACASMLYRTGDCDRARMSELLQQLRQMKQQLEEQPDELLNAEMEGLCTTLEGVWKRWYEYRSSVREFYKLKGSPKRLRPGLETLLAELAETIDDYPWSVIDDVKSFMPSSSGRKSEDTQAQPHEFDFPTTPQLPQQQVAEQPSQEPQQAESLPTDDAEDDTPATQVLDMSAPLSVEFFHKEGCDVCRRVEAKLRGLQSKYKGLQVVSYDVSSQDGSERNAVLCGRFDVPVRERRKAPAVFAEAGYLGGEEAASERLETLLRESLLAGQKTGRLAASLEKPDEEPQTSSSSATPESVEPQQEPTPQPDGNLTEATQAELVAVSRENLWAMVRSYGMLLIGTLAALVGGFVLLFGSRRKERS